MRTNSKKRQFLISLLCLLLVFTMIPTISVPAFAATDTREVDPSTIDGWKQYFGTDVKNTLNAGRIWTDKSVFKDANSLSPVTMDNADEDFLVALSAIASNKEIKGYSYVPTDTMIVLDLSASMKNVYDSDGSLDGTTTDRVDAMVQATNAAITELLELNKYNRVGVVLFSGSTSTGNSKTNTATVILPLDQYTTTETQTVDEKTIGKFLERDGTGNSMEIRINQNNKGYSTVSNDEGTISNNSKEVKGGTYTQNGVFQAWEQFEAVDDVEIEEGFQAGHERMPIMVLMTDGAPTSATTYYTNVETSNVGNGSTNCATDSVGFLNQLTASWVKLKMAEKYSSTPKFYTLGLGLDNVRYGKAVAESVLDPENSTTGINNLWTEFGKGGTIRTTAYNGNNNVNIDISNNALIKDALDKAAASNGTIKSPRYYADEYFPADDSDELIEAFDDIVDQIILQSKYYPTEAGGSSPNLGGYVQFRDDIGEFMEVKDMKGILIGDKLYSGAELASKINVSGSNVTFGDDEADLTDAFKASVKERLNISSNADVNDLILQAVRNGQLSYTDANNYGNYIGWYSDAYGNYVGFYNPKDPAQTVPKAAKYKNISYGYLGAPNDESIKASDMMYMSVRVETEIKTGRQAVLWQIPAALIPTVTYNISLEGSNYENATNITMDIQSANPARLVYEVGLRDDINELTVAELLKNEEHVHRDADGNYEFYTNRWGDGDLDGKIDIDYTHPEVHEVAKVKYVPSEENEKYYFF